MSDTRASKLFLIILLTLIPSMAFAHTAGGAAGLSGGFASGFMHPVLGWDHVAAMVAVGLWGAFLGQPAVWVLPVAFPVIMAFGGMLGVLGVQIPMVESGIAASSIVLGLLIAFAVRAPLAVSLAVVGAFAIFHGHAHGTELPEAANPIAFSIGFVIATGLLHLVGIVIGLLASVPMGRPAIRAGGALVAAVGFGFLFGVV
ncbi:HupE/UreJ family protein [Rhizobium sp. RU36D]|uniref:HupE/UreJ family protein n=1 Tax=Rhizobium sp. RU36D TaxID=1907415 RepID=UPI0009D7B8BA|nr:HupE/UreJ family protein [Rhizobium sp. RU36D]SMC47539.1 urease accessory protein [Rhizobium sp. RU36D]